MAYLFSLSTGGCFLFWQSKGFHFDGVQVINFMNGSFKINLKSSLPNGRDQKISLIFSKDVNNFTFSV